MLSSCTIVFLSCIFSVSTVLSFRFYPYNKLRTVGSKLSSYYEKSIEPTNEFDMEHELRTWHFLEQQRPAEAYVSSASSLPELISALWKAVLISQRVLDQELEKMDHTCVFGLPHLSIDDFPLCKEQEEFFDQIVDEILETIASDSDLFQPDIKRYMSINYAELTEPMYVFSLHSVRDKPIAMDFEEFDEIPADMDKVRTNDIESFPFPTVYDFIAEINRPPDPYTLSTLSHNFKVQDLKYDLEKMAKKKDPKEVVEAINCKLTRLQHWKNVLEDYQEDIPNPFINAYDWSEKVKEKFRSLKYMAKMDPKRALDTQYDKKKVFINIIDQWSDRLKRNFKYIYQPKRPVKDYTVQLLNAEWRGELKHLTKLVEQAAFLDFHGPKFIPGEPQIPLQGTEEETRDWLYTVNFPMTQVMTDMFVWMKRFEEVQDYAYSDAETKPGYLIPTRSSVTQHCYTRGYNTERILSDFWTGLAEFQNSVNEGFSGAIPAPKLSLEDRVVKSSSTCDHHGDFLQTLRELNKFTRNESFVQGKGVRPMYREWQYLSSESTDWWTDAVRELNLDETLERHIASTGPGTNATRHWSKKISEMVKSDITFLEVRDNKELMDEAVENFKEWDKYKPVMESAEKIQQLLPFEVNPLPDENSPKTLTTTADYLRSMANSFDVELEEDTFSLPFSPCPVEEANQMEKSFLFVIPRFYRGIGTDELNRFLELCNVIMHQVKYLDLKPDSRGIMPRLGMIPLHPKMVNQKGIPDFSRRAPHPAILFTVSYEDGL